jgi:hypothetical protein
MTACEARLQSTKRNLYTIRRRLDDYEKGKVTEEPPFLMDTIFNFFCECHNIKDSIQNDTLIIFDKNPVENIRENQCLQICADICNLKKHVS